jgi:hypothetical protein
MAIPNPEFCISVALLHFISAKGSKNKSIPTANATLEGIFVPNMPEDSGGISGAEKIGGWFVSINKSFQEGKRNLA